ncbi:MAG: RibD family protein [Candidatus Binataceae bacterium]
MVDRPYTLLSCAMSIDGYLDDMTDQRLLLSSRADFDRVDALRAACDAILVGATTVRKDNPHLLVRAPVRRHERMVRGLSPSPTKVTVTHGAQFARSANFFAAGDIGKLVYCASAAVGEARHRLGSLATVIDGGRHVDMRWLSKDLHTRGVRQLMVEGGETIYTQFLAADLVDELQLVIAPLFVGDNRARRFVSDGKFPWNPSRRASLAEVRAIDDVVLLRYALSARFRID